MKTLALLCGLVTSALLCWRILKSDDEGPSLASFLIWGVLDALLAWALFVQKGNYGLITLFIFTSFSTSGCIWWKRGFFWTKDDTIVAYAGIVCMAPCFFVNEYWVTVFSTAALILGGIPQLQQVNREPDTQKAWPWIGFGFSHIFSVLGGTEWSVPQRFYSVCCLFFTAILIGFMIKKSRRTFFNTIF